MPNETKPIRAVKIDAEKLAGVDLPSEDPMFSPENVLDGHHRPRGGPLFSGEQLIAEIYEDDPATIRIDEPFLFDEFILVLGGKLILTGADGVSQEFVQGDSLVIPKSFTGTWQNVGVLRELVVIERDAYVKTYGEPAPLLGS